MDVVSQSRPWMVISRLYKCLSQVTCHTVASCSRLQGHLSWPRVCHPWTLDFGIPAEMTGLKHLCITLISPAWEPLSCKLVLGRSSGSWSFKNPIPKRELH